MGIKRGQALMELAVGLFALALVVSALCGFTSYIVKSLRMQNSLRTGAADQRDTIEVGEFAASYLFKTEIVNIHERVQMPPSTIIIPN